MIQVVLTYPINLPKREEREPGGGGLLSAIYVLLFVFWVFGYYIADIRRPSKSKYNSCYAKQFQNRNIPNCRQTRNQTKHNPYMALWCYKTNNKIIKTLRQEWLPFMAAELAPEM